MARKHQILPTILGFDPPNKEVIVLHCRGKQWSGFDVYVFHADFKTPKKVGESLTGKIDMEELKGLDCWLHFRTSEAMESFGNLLVKYAKIFKIGDDSDATD